MSTERAVGLSRLAHDVRHRRERFRQALGVALAVLFAVTASATPTMYGIGVPLIAVGIGVRLWASGHVKKDKELATDGPYAYVRHPLYVGNIAIGLGFCFVSGRLWTFPVFAAFLLLFYPPAVRQEDRKLQQLFGEAWEAWADEVRALVPRLTPFEGRSRGGGWSFAQSLRQNGEPIVALFLAGLTALAWILSH